MSGSNNIYINIWDQQTQKYFNTIIENTQPCMVAEAIKQQMQNNLSHSAIVNIVCPCPLHSNQC